MDGYDVLTFDPYFCDLIITGLPELPRLGLDLFGKDMGIEAGGTFNSVRALHRLGVRVGWSTDFGTDLFSRFVIEEAEAEGIDTRLFRRRQRPLRIFSLAFSYRHDRGFVSFQDRAPRVDRAAILRRHRPRALLLGKLDTSPAGTALLEAAREIGTTIFLDSQSTKKTLRSKGVPETLRRADVLMLNEAEALALTGAKSLAEAGASLGELTPLVIIKTGDRGAAAFRRGEETLHVPTLAVEVVDTVGAGDCFDAGFIAAHLRGEPLLACLVDANICGSLSTTAHGTVATPTLAEVGRRRNEITALSDGAGF